MCFFTQIAEVVDNDMVPGLVDMLKGVISGMSPISRTQLKNHREADIEGLQAMVNAMKQIESRGQGTDGNTNGNQGVANQSTSTVMTDGSTQNNIPATNVVVTDGNPQKIQTRLLDQAPTTRNRTRN